MRGRAVALLAFAVLASAASLPRHAAGRIAFGSKTGIFVVLPDGSELTRLTSSWDEEPAWSRDGRRIAFTRVRASIGQIYAMNADGSSVRRLTSGPTDSTHPSWSPDGRFVAFEHDTSAVDGKVGIYVMRADGTHVRRLVSSTEFDFSPAWSPDGRQIVFERGFGAAFVVNVDGGGLRRIGRGRASNPAWSPDGKRLAYDSETVVRGRPRLALYVMNADGSGRKLIRYGFAQPSWSPDGERLAVFRIVGGGKGAIYVVEARPGGRVRLVTSRAFAEGPSWQSA
jgi:Tol biopolymer transport system component